MASLGGAVKGVLLVPEDKMLLRYQIGSSSANGNCRQWVFSNLEGFLMISGVSGFRILL